MLVNECGIVRSEVLWILGIFGVFDLYVYRGNEICLYGEGVLSEEGVRGVR